MIFHIRSGSSRRLSGQLRILRHHLDTNQLENFGAFSIHSSHCRDIIRGRVPQELTKSIQPIFAYAFLDEFNVSVIDIVRTLTSLICTLRARVRDIFRLAGLSAIFFVV